MMSHIAKAACHIFRENSCRDILREAYTKEWYKWPQKGYVPIVPKPEGSIISVVRLIIWAVLLESISWNSSQDPKIKREHKSKSPAF